MSAFDVTFFITQLLPKVKHLNPKSIKHFLCGKADHSPPITVRYFVSP